MRYTVKLLFCLEFALFIGFSSLSIGDDEIEKQKELWSQKFQFEQVVSGEVPPKNKNNEEKLKFSIKVDNPSRQFIRVSLPFPYGKIKETKKLVLQSQGAEILADCRVLTTYGGGEGFIRRAILSFVDDFQETEKQYMVVFNNQITREENTNKTLQIGGNRFEYDGKQILVHKEEEQPFKISLICPEEKNTKPDIKHEVIEYGEHYLWVNCVQIQWGNSLCVCHYNDGQKKMAMLPSLGSILKGQEIYQKELKIVLHNCMSGIAMN